jgi:lysyl-tRNA synthetase class 2
MQNSLSLFEIQLEMLQSLKQEGIDPYGQKFVRTGLAHAYVENFEEEKNVRVAGRVTSCRDMGKTKFWDLTDLSGKIQLFINPKNMSEPNFSLLSKIGMADIIGVEGKIFKTKTGEISIRVSSLTLLSKALRPMPEKYHGLKDVESRFRQRYLDLMANKEVRELFQKRTQIVKSIRSTLDNAGFMEVETPMLQSLYGGAAARPFVTHHNALNRDLYLRIAPELYLKRLLVGGLEKVYEINRNFRNEGLSRRHNPEFTMLEVYSAYDNYEDMMDLCENLIRQAAKTIGKEFSEPFQRITLFDAVKQQAPVGLERWEDLRDIAKKQHFENWQTMDEGLILSELFERYVEAKLVSPTFVTDYPLSLCPLAKRCADAPHLTERFELFIDGQEIANAYSELNDPIEQKKRFEEQIVTTPEEQGLTKHVDTDYVEALEHGMPPAGGLGIGIDRLVMILTGAPSIREVILFPILRTTTEEAHTETLPHSI